MLLLPITIIYFSYAALFWEIVLVKNDTREIVRQTDDTLHPNRSENIDFKIKGGQS